MPQSLSNVLLHIVFSTKERRPYLQVPQLRENLHGYLIGVMRNLECDSLCTNSVADHIHILCQLSRKIAIADLIREVKTSSSAWVKDQPNGSPAFHWQLGYGAFSVSQSNMELVKRYITNQEEHHRKITFQEEFRELCRRHGIEIDERYIWD